MMKIVVMNSIMQIKIMLKYCSIQNKQNHEYKQLMPFETHMTLVEDNEHFLYICKVKIIFTNDKNMSCKRISYKYLLFLNLNKGLFKSFSEKTFNQMIKYNMLKFDENENKY